MQKYDFTAPANGAPQVVNVAGRYIKYVTGNAGGNDTGLIVTPGSKPGSKILLYPGQAMTLPNDGTAGPNGWTLANAVGQAQITGTVVIGNGKIDDNTLQGTVQVVDGGKARTLANAAFMVYGAMTGDATHYPQVQLFNNSANTRMVVDGTMLNDGAANSAATVVLNQTRLGTLVTAGISKRSSGAQSTVGAMYVGTTTSAVSGAAIAASNLAANATTPIVIHEPIVLDPGWGITCWGGVLNTAFGCVFEWYEEPNV